MYSRTDIEKIVRRKVVDDAVGHISDMMEEIQQHLIFDTPTSNFTKRCADECWTYAAAIGDVMNKEILTKTTIFQDFVKSVKTSPEYISKIRAQKLDEIL
jgi:hypothetical protein